MITVMRAGPLTTVQDLGRPGYAHLGVPRSGALDMPALRRANALVGNSVEAAVLETTLMGCALRFEVAARVAVTGAFGVVRVDKQPVSTAAAFEVAFAVAAGAVLDVGRAQRGVRSYVAVAGGIDVEPVLGSRSTDTLSGLGPPRLVDGMTLPIGREFGGSAVRQGPLGGEVADSAARPGTLGGDFGGPASRPGTLGRDFGVSPVRQGPLDGDFGGSPPRHGPLVRDFEASAARHGPPPPGWVGPSEAGGSDSFSWLSTGGGELVLGVRGGPRDDWFVTGELFGSPYTVTPLSDRVGCRLAGSALTRAQAGELPSEGVVLGAVQVPADGQPLIFLADHPTTGGYPVIGVVDDVTPLAQARPGTTVRFRAID
ncbi:biotin-dependent carboxyltransferase family protein [Actinoplanes sp. CA-142083]|uniref:5-oxoprolinase subunit C family protein n=1 Tax=Actinoplanes sp. CA-142083 TaxID=3239903 RepID=UPI003D8B1BB3